MAFVYYNTAKIRYFFDSSKRKGTKQTNKGQNLGYWQDKENYSCF